VAAKVTGRSISYFCVVSGGRLRAPDSPRSRAAQESGAFAASGVNAPIPVITIFFVMNVAFPCGTKFGAQMLRW
jgi:hypothetical protein